MRIEKWLAGGHHLVKSEISAGDLAINPGSVFESGKSQHLSNTAQTSMKPIDKGTTLWFFGLPSAGKSTLANRVVNHLANFILLDGDEVRKSVANFNMDQAARLMHLSYMAFCCRRLNESGVNVAAAFVTPLENHRARIQEILPDVKFIWVRCAQEVCIARDPKGLWKMAAQGNLPQLTGAGGEWEDPGDSTMTIPSDRISVDESFTALKKHFSL